MHKTPAGERRKSLIRDAKELAKDARFLEKAARAPSARTQEAQRLQEETVRSRRRPKLKLQSRLEDQDCMGEMDKVKQTRKGPKTSHLLDDLLARGQQDAQCAPGKLQEDGCRRSLAEGQKDEGRGDPC